MSKIKKVTLGAVSIAAVVAPIASTISCNMSVGYKPALFNYVDYISERGQEILEKNFNYKTFDDLPEFEQALKQGRTIGGIGSDYYNAKLIKQGQLKKIDFHKALHIPSTVTNIATELQNLYTTDVWNQLAQFDSYLGDVDGDGTVDHLWEYMVPYFTQSKVLAFNISRGNWSAAELATLNPTTETSKAKQDAIENMVSDHSYLGLLKFMKQHGYTKFVNNDYQRDNAMIGSEKTGHFTGKMKESNYKSFVNNYISTIEEGLGIDFHGDDVISEASGVASLDHLINPKQSWGASFLYNGDAQYAHIGGSKYDGDDTPADWAAQGANIRFLTPENPVYLLDGFVISSKSETNSELENHLYEDMYNAVFAGGEKPLAQINDDTPAFINYDFVGYTTPFKSIFDYVNDDSAGGYFEDDFVGKMLLPTAGVISPAATINQNRIIWPVDDQLQNDFSIYYEQATKS